MTDIVPGAKYIIIETCEPSHVREARDREAAEQALMDDLAAFERIIGEMGDAIAGLKRLLSN